MQSPKEFTESDLNFDRIHADQNFSDDTKEFFCNYIKKTFKESTETIKKHNRYPIAVIYFCSAYYGLNGRCPVEIMVITVDNYGSIVCINTEIDGFIRTSYNYDESENELSNLFVDMIQNMNWYGLHSSGNTVSFTEEYFWPIFTDLMNHIKKLNSKITQ